MRKFGDFSFRIFRTIEQFWSYVIHIFMKNSLKLKIIVKSLLYHKYGDEFSWLANIHVTIYLFCFSIGKLWIIVFYGSIFLHFVDGPLLQSLHAIPIKKNNKRSLFLEMLSSAVVSVETNQ